MQKFPRGTFPTFLPHRLGYPPGAGDIDRSSHHAAEVLRLMPEFSISRYVPKEPFRLSSDRKNLTEALRKAGLPE
jgi:hypothetical protein